MSDLVTARDYVYSGVEKAPYLEDAALFNMCHIYARAAFLQQDEEFTARERGMFWLAIDYCRQARRYTAPGSVLAVGLQGNVCVPRYNVEVVCNPMNIEKFKITRVAAYGLVLNEEKIMLCRLSDRVEKHTGKWTLPGGGLEFGESPEEAMIRELHEETGLHVQPTKIAGIDSRFSNHTDQSMHSIRIVYFAQLLGGVLTHEIDGSTDMCQWWSLEEARSLPLVDLAEVGLRMILEDA